MRAPYSPVRLIYGKNSKIGHSLPYRPVHRIVWKIRYIYIHVCREKDCHKLKVARIALTL